MTIAEYKAKYGEKLKMVARHEWFVALIQTLKDVHPVKRLHARADGDKLHGAPMLLAQIDGYEECLANIESIQTPDAPQQVPEESAYTESEIPIP